jgi:hypothetical protein
VEASTTVGARVHQPEVTVSRSVRPLAVLLLAVAACAPVHTPDLAETLAGVPSADAMRGIRLGMSVAELRRARPALRPVNGRMIDTASGFLVSYRIDASGPDTLLAGVWAQREFASQGELEAAWAASVEKAQLTLGEPVACYESPVASGSTGPAALHAAVWETGPVHLSALTSTLRRSTSAMFYDAARPPHDHLNTFEITIDQRRAWERVATSVMRVVTPSRHTCGGTAAAARTVAVGAPAAAGASR